MSAYTPKTGARCSCKRGIQRDNCPTCEGTGMVIDFAAIHRRRNREALVRVIQHDRTENADAIRLATSDARIIPAPEVSP